ncbi:glutamate ABC transporter substrate-binding protein [Pseudonocardia sp. CA-107938]|uniref:glutamate ABC transporter substrate-binding protein n=1 Tax=Pseudonocardia sp. CA-107938 TaxID=3240021 RepID=UPI003D89F5E2
MTDLDHRRVNARRPLLVVAVGAVLALISLLLPALGQGGEAAAPPPPPPPAPAAAPAAPCTPVESLRPAGPLPPPNQMPDGSTMARIHDRGRLVAAVDQGKFRVGFRNPANGNLEGSDIDVVRSIAEAIFGDPDRVRYVVTSIADRTTVLEKNQVDIVVNTFSVTCARQKTIAFSTPYQTVTQRLLVQRNSGIRSVDDLKGKTVCTSAGSVPEQELKKYPGVTVQGVASTPDCIVGLQTGRVAAISNDDVILAGLAAQDPQTEVISDSRLPSSRSAVGIPIGNEDMVRFVNAVLEKSIADGSLAASNTRWLGDLLNPLPPPPAPVYRD